ncbi:hypothetical protein D926_01414 [Enterococcus faecalis D811610-10]|uniref:Uncharacterized protein n=1 Tax=Enterococcus faecalis RP2S-4 TaxID=1244145 RepID=A0ABC9TMT2_ENTFL|nr:hypothetical protein HMPREF9494_00919 [Enterococcus faecalis TX2137]EJU88032.1 hypothetical protein HMPREF1327_02423 [Enterococcus faecalis 599]EPH76126.1 hypothetical protein D926_01414 [Enterococcus faecalis D811610-10]EPH84610.1 hypothetical protein D924_01401 [Enterococcus faecalis 06-MB-S-10]EPH92050.1 hypothetical protein D923_00380 [Enterococcus faecalis 06-MB-S-04]EPI10181.1 hypothetical protein D358_00871 [Enterococcus faecalis RP2S-4]EPI29981.1 hypothetical protein D350_01353 [En
MDKNELQPKKRIKANKLAAIISLFFNNIYSGTNHLTFLVFRLATLFNIYLN